METPKDDTSTDFRPRSYQVELFECARKKNSILVLGTGSGKTFISILLIKELADQIRGPLSKGNKRTVFVVNTVPLVHQQAAAIEQHTPFKVGKYEGSMGVDYWTDEHWQEELENHEVLVVVAQIFLDLILHARLPLSMVNLLIIDECHHATGNHPMREIMREYERLKQHSPKSLPRVLGLTACVVHRKCKKNKVMTYMVNLETAMDCALVTSDDPTTVLKFTTGPKEVVVCYSLNTILSEYQEIVRAQLIGLQGDITSGDLTGKAKKQVEKKIKNIIHIMDTLGDWCVARAIKYEIENLEEAEEMEEDFQLRETLTLLKGRLKDIYESCALKEKNMKNPLENVSLKVMRLIEVFSKCNEEVFGLIFVERRNTAKILYDLLLEVAKQNQEYSFLKPSYVVGCNTRPGADIRLAELEMRKQKETLEKFRKGESNFLISTSVLEEGVDIRKCNLVVRFDMPQNYRGYVQSRGRARAKPSVYLLMVHEMDLKDSIECIEVYREIEKSLQNLCHDRDLPKPEDTLKHFEEDEYIAPYQPYGPTGPKITANSSIPLINMYCGKLPADKFTNSAPVVEVQKRGLKFIVGIRLPIMSPLKDMVYGSEFDTQDLAKKDAALNLCIKLHEMEELNNNLRPKDFDDETLLEGLVELPPEKDPEGVPETGTRKRKRVYTKDVCKPFSDTCKTIYFLYAIDFKPCNDKETSVTIDSSACDTRIGFICKEGLVLSPFHLFFLKWGSVLVNVQEVGPLTDLDYELLKQIQKFHRLVFENLLEVKPNLMCFDPKESKHDVYIVPLDSSGIINLEVLSEINSYHSLKPSVMTTFEKVHSSTERSAFEDALIFPLYGTPSDQMYFVSQILDDVNPLSSFPDSRNCTYNQFFWERYKIKIQNMNQPLLEAKHIPKELNYVKKIPITFKSNKLKFVPRFVPELCGIMPLKASLWWQIMLIPSVLHRLNSLNLMHTFINETEVLPPLSVNKEILDCSWTRKFIQGIETSNGNKLFAFLKHKCNYIHPFKMLHAFTAKEANEHQDFNLERLELLGDSFLKFSTGEALFARHDIAQEGQLSVFRGKLVSNKTLYLLARQKGLVGKIAAKAFSPKTNGFLPGFCVIPWIEEKLLEHGVPSRIFNEFPENVTDKESLEKELLKTPQDIGGTSYNPWTEHEVADKNIADCVEAIIGAYFLVCGREAAVSFMDWLGIGVFQGTSLLQHDYSVKTACARPECIPNVGRLYRKAGLDRLEKKIGYTFQDKSFIVQAVTHTSYCQNQATDCYQRLEFLGDAVLDFLVTSHIFLRYTDYTPGQLSDLRSYFVKNETLARCAIQLNLQQHLLHMAPMLETAFNKLLAIMREDPMSEELNTEDDVDDCEDIELPKALGDIVESLIGAVYLDSKRSLTETWKVIENILGNLLYTSFEKIHLNPVRLLLEKLPQRVWFEKIEDQKVSTYKVVVEGFGTYTASAKNLRLAKKKAALCALKGIQNREAENAIAQLPQPPHM